MGNAVVDISTYEAASDLSSYQFYPVKIGTTVALAGANEAHGILQNDPKAGEPAVVRIFGESYVMANGNTAISLFDPLGSNANNLMVKEITDNDAIIGYALEAHATNVTAKIKAMIMGIARY